MAAAFDPSIISEIPSYAPNPVKAQSDALNLAGGVQSYQSGEIDLQKQRQAQADEQQARELLKGVDLNTPEGQAKLTQLPPELRMKMMQGVAKTQSAQKEVTLQDMDIAAKKLDILEGVQDPIVAQLESIKNSPGMTPAMLDAKTKQLIVPAILQLQKDHPELQPEIQRFLADPNHMTYNGLIAVDQQTATGRAALASRRAEKHQEEVERENRKRDDLAERRITDAETKEANKAREAKEGIITDESAQLAVDRMLNGEKAQDVLANFGRGKQGPANIAKVQNLLASTAKSRGISPQEITARNVELKGIVKEQQTEATIAGKITYAEKEIQKIGPKVLETSAKVPRGSFLPWNKLKLATETQLSDPNLKQLKAYLTTLTNSYDVLGGRGGTDVEKRAHNRELLDAADGPEALKAAVDAIIQEASLSHEAASESMHVDRSRLGGAPGTTPAAPAGGGPPPSPAAGAAGGGAQWGKATVVGQ
jgi:hypothetical protein